MPAFPGTLQFSWVSVLFAGRNFFAAGVGDVNSLTIEPKRVGNRVEKGTIPAETCLTIAYRNDERFLLVEEPKLELLHLESFSQFSLRVTKQTFFAADFFDFEILDIHVPENHFVFPLDILLRGFENLLVGRLKYHVDIRSKTVSLSHERGTAKNPLLRPIAAA